MIYRLSLLLNCLAVLASLFLTTAPAQSSDEDREGGILGTGIVGTITRLGSIHVNGQHILIAPGMKVASALGTIPAHSLRPNDTVAVLVVPDGSYWRAVSLTQTFAVVGPVSAKVGTGLEIMGTRVIPAAGTSVPRTRIGDWVAVSGLWQGDRIIASRVKAIPPQAKARIRGSYLALNKAGFQMVGGTRLTGISPRHLRPGDLVRAEGVPIRDGLEVTRLGTGEFAGPRALVLVQGYLSPPQVSGLYTVLGTGLVAYTDQPGMIDPAAQTTQCGFKGQLLNQVTALETGLSRDRLLRLGCIEE